MKLPLDLVQNLYKYGEGGEGLTLNLMNLLISAISGQVAIFLVIFLLTSSVATVAICCLELKAVWISYK